jgi:hypothetical protein
MARTIPALNHPKTVVAFVGENLNGILESQSRRFLDLLKPMGLVGEVISVTDPALERRLDEALQMGVLFAWGFAGVGARLSFNGQNLWTTTGIPFISVLADAPFIMPINHHVPSPAVVNGYIYREWLDFQRDHIRSEQIAALLPHGVISNTERFTTPWSQRPTRMIFVKTGADPELQRARWAGWPVRLRTILHQCADTLIGQPTGSILPTVMKCLEAHQIHLNGSKPLFFGLLHELDTFLRAHRGTVMARALLALPVDIVGGGWEHVRNGPGVIRARFHDARPAGELDALFSQAQFVVNVTPNFGSGAHERVLRGFAARACVVSDKNRHAAEILDLLPSYHGLDWSDADLTERLADHFHATTAYDDRLDAAQDYVERHHDPVAFLLRMRELAELARAQVHLRCYALDAA